jgi:hypothetical protein
MRFSLIISLAALLFVSNGCALLPKSVEFFQKKVKAVPELSPRGEELRRQAAQRAEIKARETVVAALTENASTNVVAPAKETEQLTEAVSESLGPPSRPSTQTTDALIQSLQKQIATLNEKLDAYRERTEKLEGKKIEGTGFLQIPYFAWLGFVALLVFVAWHLLHTFLTVASAANPGAAVGVGAMNVAASLAGKGLHQVVAGGKEFLAWLNKEVTDPALQKKISDAFVSIQKQKQDQDVQTVVKTLIK